MALLRTIFAQDTAEAAHAQWKQVADTLRERFPKLVELMDGSREDVLAYSARRICARTLAWRTST